MFFGLAHILFGTGVAGNEINKVGALARNVKFARKSLTCGVAGKAGVLIEVRTKLALGVGAKFFCFQF